MILITVFRAATAWKVSKYGVFSDLYFPAFELNTRDPEYLSIFSLNAGKQGPEKTPYLDYFQAGIYTKTV